jgi:hypothetical protein
MRQGIGSTRVPVDALENRRRPAPAVVAPEAPIVSVGDRLRVSRDAAGCVFVMQHREQEAIAAEMTHHSPFVSRRHVGDAEAHRWRWIGSSDLAVCCAHRDPPGSGWREPPHRNLRVPSVRRSRPHSPGFPRDFSRRHAPIGIYRRAKRISSLPSKSESRSFVAVYPMLPDSIAGQIISRCMSFPSMTTCAVNPFGFSRSSGSRSSTR